MLENRKATHENPIWVLKDMVVIPSSRDEVAFVFSILPLSYFKYDRNACVVYVTNAHRLTDTLRRVATFLGLPSKDTISYDMVLGELTVRIGGSVVYKGKYLEEPLPSLREVVKGFLNHIQKTRGKHGEYNRNN